MSTLREPFRIRAVEPIRVLSRAERREKLDRAGYNLHRLSAIDIALDLIRDSGSGAFTLDRIAALLRSEDVESGAKSGSRLDAFVRDLTGFRHVVPTRQAAAAERIALSLLAPAGSVVLGNSLGESPRENLRFAGAEAHALLPPESLDPDSRRAFKGGPDLAALERAIASFGAERISCVLVALPSDPVGGQPVSLDALRSIRDACRRHRIPFWLEASRFAENAFLARRDDPALRSKSVSETAREMFALADGAYVCGPRDAISSSGGFIALNDDALAHRCRTLAILTEGPSVSGGSSGRDFEMLLLALRESLDEDALAHRHRLCAHLAENLEALGVPVVHPPGCDSVYVDAARFLPHVPRSQFPGQALACALYVEGGVRGSEVGSLSLGAPRAEASNGRALAAPFELLRLSLTSRAHTAGHVDYVVDLLAALIRQRGEIHGLRIVKEETALRLYSAELEPVP